MALIRCPSSRDPAAPGRLSRGGGRNIVRTKRAGIGSALSPIDGVALGLHISFLSLSLLLPGMETTASPHLTS